MNSGRHSPTHTWTFPANWLLSAFPISHTILQNTHLQSVNQNSSTITSKPFITLYTRCFNVYPCHNNICMRYARLSCTKLRGLSQRPCNNNNKLVLQQPEAEQFRIKERVFKVRTIILDNFSCCLQGFLKCLPNNA